MGLSDIKGLQIHVMTEKRFIPARFSRYVKKIHPYDTKLDPSDWIARINDLVCQYKIDVVMPVHDTAIRQLIEYKSQLQNTDHCLLPPSLSAFDQAKNKDMLAALLTDMKIPVPTSWKLDKEFENLELIKECDFPVLLKPTQVSGSGRGIKRFESKQELADYLSLHPLTTTYFVQQWIEGYDLGCHMLCKDGEILAFTMQKGFLFSPRPFTPQVGMHMLYDEKVYQLASKVMKRLSWSGLADMDLRFDQKKGEYNVLEINPRFWLTMVASQVAGVNYPWLYCRTVLGESFEMPVYKECDYWTWNGLRLALPKNPGLFLKPGKIWHNTPVKYAFRDPLMILIEFMQTLQIFLRTKLRKLQA